MHQSLVRAKIWLPCLQSNCWWVASVGRQKYNKIITESRHQPKLQKSLPHCELPDTWLRKNYGHGRPMQHQEATKYNLSDSPTSQAATCSTKGETKRTVIWVNMLGCKTHATIHCKNLTTKMTLAHSDTASLLKTGPETDTHKVRSKKEHIQGSILGVKPRSDQEPGLWLRLS